MLDIATMVSSTVLCIKLVLWGAISAEKAGLILIGVVVCLAIRRTYTKLALAMVAVYLLVKSFAGNDARAFYEGLNSIFTLVVVLVGSYVMVRGVFGEKG